MQDERRMGMCLPINGEPEVVYDLPLELDAEYVSLQQRKYDSLQLSGNTLKQTTSRKKGPTTNYLHKKYALIRNNFKKWPPDCCSRH